MLPIISTLASYLLVILDTYINKWLVLPPYFVFGRVTNDQEQYRTPIGRHLLFQPAPLGLSFPDIKSIIAQ